MVDGVVLDKWQYHKGSPDEWADIPGGAMTFDGTNWAKWMFLRLVIDPVNDTYISLECGNLSLDLSNIALYSTAETVEAGGRCEITVYTDADIATDVWIDDVLISDTES
jgi:hypothetical protein